MEVSSETKLRRFLLYASESNVYLPGSRLQWKFYEKENLESFRTLLKSLDKDVVLKLIKWVHGEKLSPHPEVIPFVLTECCRIKEWRADALNMATLILRDVDDFLLFFKFAFEVSPKLGTGRGVKRFIKTWYDRQQTVELVGMVGERPKFRGWRHADLIKLAHLKSERPAKAAIYAYAVGGVENMVKKFGQDENAKWVVDHLVKINEFKKEKSPDKTIAVIEEYILSIGYVNHIHYKNKKVWKAVLPRMTVDEIVPRLHLLSKYGMFRSHQNKTWDPQFIPLLLDRIVNKTNVTRSKIQPSTICLELNRYQNEPSLKYQTAVKRNKRAKKAPQISKEYVQALEEVMLMAFENIKPTGLNYTIIIDDFKLQSRRCAYRRFISPQIAAAVLALSLNKAGNDVKIVTFTGKNIEFWTGPKTTSVHSLASVFGTESLAKPFIRSIINFCSPLNSKTEDTDVFVILANTIKYGKYLDVVKQHREKNPKSPRFVFCSLCGLKYSGPIDDEENAIITSGFNDRLFQLINGFGKEPPANTDG
ncbi:60 kDa SS-A/Ro ribonucleoprotein-like [Cimex lectularius]|uniref:TROVE domain-containing protein n=1 Tax=Cimex lectularius TaxID=79782 RepID=A0A8I6S157_CIMLE|nr:60 kDa SS-A/Ro ribonucleoprotein-like [Cimex lectularius]XP_014251558.1 60 kDa SS-A/Ro ribonucleoprotein-like [Cimex lectularius]